MKMALLTLIAIAAAAQEQSGSIAGVVIDSVSRQPVKKAAVTLSFSGVPNGQNANSKDQSATTDATGAFTFTGLAPGRYQLTVIHQNYPSVRSGGTRKTVQVSASDNSTSVTVEMIPSAVISGHVTDEDGDPMSGCIVQTQPPKNFNQRRFTPNEQATTEEDGSYRIYGIPAGKYVVSAQCTQHVFEPRPLSAGPDPAPTRAYPLLFYPAASDVQSAQSIELAAGAEKSGMDFQMRPAAITQIHGTLTAGSADWRGRQDLRAQLIARDSSDPRARRAGARINASDGTFDLQEVFPGSYWLAVVSRDFASIGMPSEESNRVGAMMRLDVADKPLAVSMQLQRAMDVSGTVEIDGGNNDSNNPIAMGQVNIHLSSDNGFSVPPPPTTANADGSFTIKSVLPAEWRVRVFAGNAFLKSVRLGNDDVTDRPIDLTSGAAAPLKIVVSTNTATIRGTAPSGSVIFLGRIEEGEPVMGSNTVSADSSGQFTATGLTPGKYRVVASDGNGSPPEEGGQEISVAEGETATLELKPDSQP